MTNEAYRIVESELMILGDILCAGIIKKGLFKVGSMPESATPADFNKAFDAHIEAAMVSFVGPAEARKIALRIKSKLSKMSPEKGAAA